MIKISGWAADNEACGYYRIRLPLSGLPKSRYQTRASRFLDLDWKPDVVIGQRIHLPGPTKTWVEMGLKKQRPRRIFELDDNLFDVDPGNEMAHAYFNRPDVREPLMRNILVADRVIVSTEPLATVVRQHRKDVVVVPNMVDQELLQHDATPTGPGIIFGWQGSPTHGGDWPEVSDALRRMLRRFPETRVHTWGATYAVDTLPRDRVTHTGFQQIQDYYRSVKAHVMLAPLRPNIFNRSKSHIRVLEAAAMGIPVIATDFGPYAAFVKHGETGLLVQRPHEWEVFMRMMVNDPAMRLEMGANARRQAAEWTIQRGAWMWEEAING